MAGTLALQARVFNIENLDEIINELNEMVEGKRPYPDRASAWQNLEWLWK